MAKKETGIERRGQKEAVCKETFGLERFLIKFGRFNAWLLIVFIILYFVSGFGMVKTRMIYDATGGLFDRVLSFKVHEYLTLPMAFSFLCHTLIAIRFAMIRWNFRNKTVLNWVFMSTGIVLFALTAYVYFS